METGRYLLTLIGSVTLALAGCAAPVEEDVGTSSDKYTQGGGASITYVNRAAVCFDDYNCWAPFATTICYSNGFCTYEERLPADYRGALATKQGSAPWRITRASNCDKWCGYLMRSSGSNVSRWDLGGNYGALEACGIIVEACFEGRQER